MMRISYVFDIKRICMFDSVCVLGTIGSRVDHSLSS